MKIEEIHVSFSKIHYFFYFFTKILDSARGAAGGDVIGNINIR